MNTLYIRIRSFLFSWKVLFTLIALCAMSGGVYVFTRSSSSEFDGLFATYRDVSEKEMVAALVPGVKDNPIRNELDRTLAEVLARAMTNEERLKLAQHGLDVLDRAEIQIDAIGEAEENTAKAIDAIERSTLSLGAVFGGSPSHELMELARKRSGIISDIRGLSYRANYHTEDIFKQIVADKGALTATHISNLNDLIPKVEEQFNERSNLYFELESVNNQMETVAAKL